MITKWGVKNFKSILEADLELGPLTIFTGVNSSGKSSFLHSIAMLAQAARRHDNGIIMLKGDLIDLDSFERIYTNRASEYKNHLLDIIGINLSLQVEEDEHIYFELGLSSEEDKGEDYLKIPQGLLRCKKKEGDEDFSIKWKESKDLPNNTSELYDEIWKKIKSGENYILNNKFEIAKCNVCFLSFLPFSMLYKPCSLEDEDNDLHPSIYLLTKLLAAIPAEKLTEKEDAEKYVERIISEKETIFHDIDDEFSYKDILPFARQMFYFCANNLWWTDYWNDKKKIAYTILFETLPNFGKMFSNFKDVHDSGRGYYKIELSDWYQVLSMQDKHIQDAIKLELEDLANFGAELSCYFDDVFDCIFSDFYYHDFQEHIDSINFPNQLFLACQYLHAYFSNQIKYIGPLREDPEWDCTVDEEELKKKKIKNGEDESDAEYAQRIIDVGVKGERTPVVVNYLHNNQYEIENYYSPEIFEDPNYKPEKKKNFSEALTEWLKYIGLSDKFKKRELEKDKRFSVNMVIDEQEFALPQLGTGVSQVLPILVMCLAAPIGSTLIIEQPELHLHPKMQSRLADFFIAMSLSGRQCLIETHSEYIIETLRYRILMLSDRKFVVLPDRKAKPLHEHTKLYFVTKKDGVSHFKDIVIDENASLDEMPDDFFDESHKIIRKMMDEVAKKEEMDRKND
jgi:predicted ATPase